MDGKVRTPLFPLHVLAAFTFAFGLGFWERFSHGRERFVTDPELLGPYRLLVPIVTVLAGIGAMALLGIEIAVRRGWDPSFIRVRRIGVKVVAKRRADHLEAQRELHVLLPDGTIHPYIAEEDEYRAVSEGDVVALQTFGQFVTRIRVLQSDRVSTDAEAAVRSHFRRASLRPRTGVAVGVALTLPVAAFLMGQKLLPILFRQDWQFVRLGRYRRRGVWHELTGQEALAANVPWMIGCAILIAVVLLMFLKGWDEDLFYDSRDFR